MKARDYIAKGTYWRVGSGSMIKVWGDNWIPREGSFKASPICTPTDDSFMVAKWDMGSWGADTIRSLFQPKEVGDILRIYLIDINTPDRLVLVWYHTKSGLLSVKSAYHQILQEKFLRDGGEEISNGEALRKF